MRSGEHALRLIERDLSVVVQRVDLPLAIVKNAEFICNGAGHGDHLAASHLISGLAERILRWSIGPHSSLIIVMVEHRFWLEYL